MKKVQKHPFIGIFMILLGGYFMLIGFGQLESESVHVPLWVMVFLGCLFVLCGFVLINGKKLPKKSLLASLILLCFSIIGFGMGFFQETSVLEKWIFGSSSMICFLLSLVAFTHKE